MGSENLDTSVELGDISLRNPILTASGTFGYGEELQDVVELNRLGGIVLKSITKEPREGNRPPRVVETPSGMINSIGLENPGIDRFLEETLPRIRTFPTRLIGSVAGFSVEEYVEITRRMQETGDLDALEMNYSCPNTEARGVCFGMDAGLTERLTEQISSVCDLPLIVKLSPNVTDIQKIALAAERGGADMLSLINTLIGLEVDWKNRSPELGTGLGGLSGPAIRPVAQRMVWETSEAVDLPIIGIGGISSAEDVARFLVAGAGAVQVGTRTFVNPSAPNDILDELEKLLAGEEVSSPDELVGTLEMPEEQKED